MNSYLAGATVVSAFLVVSAGTVVVVSGVGTTVFVSIVEFVALSAVDSASFVLSLHATKAPIANTKRSFFIVPVF